MSTGDKAELFSQFETPIRALFGQKGCELAIVILCFPLLERYLRETSGTHEENSLNEKAMDDLRVIFPELASLHEARTFWHIYRNGLLHQAAFSAANSRGVIKPYGGISGDTPKVYYDEGADCFFINPEPFANAVLEFIGTDLKTLEAKSSANHELYSVGMPHAAKFLFSTPPSGNFNL